MRNKYHIKKGTILRRDFDVEVIQVTGNIVFERWTNLDGSLGQNWFTMEQVNDWIDMGIDEVINP